VSKVNGFEWNGRPVVLGEFSVLDGKAVRDAYAVDPERGMWEALAKSARYADDGLPVFTSADDVLAQPWRLQSRLMRLSNEAQRVNAQVDDAPAEGGGPSP